MIRFENITKVLGGNTVLDNISFEVAEGETFVIVGLSGAGKSVTLKHMIRLMQPDAGIVIVDGEAIGDLGRTALQTTRSKFGVLFQSAALLQWMSVHDNVALPLREHTNMTEEEIGQLVTEKLRLLNLSDAGAMFPAELSGGMRKVHCAGDMVKRFAYDKPR